MKRVIEIEFLSSGQQVQHGDIVYSANLTFSGTFMWDPDPDVVKQVARLLVHDFDDSDTNTWASFKLKEIKKTDRGKWFVKIVQPYLD